MAIFGYFLKIESVQKVFDYTLKMKKPTDRGHMQLTFYRSKYFKMPSFLSCNSSKDLVPNQGSVEILDPDRDHIMLSFKIHRQKTEMATTATNNQMLVVIFVSVKTSQNV